MSITYTTNIAKQNFFKEHEKYIPDLPEYERTLIDYFFRGIPQKEIAKILLCTQGAISSRLRRAMSRLTFLKELDAFNITDLEKDLKPVLESLDKKINLFETRINTEIIKGMIQTTSQTGTANIVNRVLQLSGGNKMNQIKVRHRFSKCLEKLRALKDTTKYKKYYSLLNLIATNLYKRKEIRLPHFDRG
jgi:DNA-binding CsgD family transcriptional regulator